MKNDATFEKLMKARIRELWSVTDGNLTAIISLSSMIDDDELLAEWLSVIAKFRNSVNELELTER